MTIRTNFGERVNRSFLTSKTKLFSLVAILFFYATIQLTAQDGCPPDITVSGATTGQWTAPTDQGEGPWSVQISARGASGGNAVGGGNGGSGALMIGTFVIQNGDVILAVGGDPGGDGTDGHGGGGGGGAGAVNCGPLADCATGAFLIIGAGGNGGQVDAPSSGKGGSVASGSGDGGAGGGDNGGGGGGGDSDDGGSGTGLSPGLGGQQALTVGITFGGTGSQGTNSGGAGMGGGGGGGSGSANGSGGGGGQTGAPGGNALPALSFNDGTNQQNTPGSTGGAPNLGEVIITCLGSLPINLINFKAILLERNVKLEWSTASEKDNHGYDIERSTDNRNWTTLGFVPGHGTTAETSEYAFTDDHPLSGVNYYRLKQMDTDGSFQHTPMVVADVRANALQFDIFPNPSTDGALTFRTVSQQEGNALLEIWDWAGYKVWNETQRLWEGTTVWPVSMTNFPKGAYTVRLQMPDGTVQFRKIVLQ